jgi:mannose-6-phosphate isomerase-like protein (cupin superfamily)
MEERMGSAERISDPGICVVRLSRGERVSAELAALLNPVDPASFHEYRLPASTPVELHYHDFDEYWLFTVGNPLVTLRSPSGLTRQFHLGPGDMVTCVRGIEHTLWADHELVYFQYSSVRQGGEREGHLTR